jgi:hypothetical protein
MKFRQISDVPLTSATISSRVSDATASVEVAVTQNTSENFECRLDRRFPFFWVKGSLHTEEFSRPSRASLRECVLTWKYFELCNCCKWIRVLFFVTNKYLTDVWLVAERVGEETRLWLEVQDFLKSCENMTSENPWSEPPPPKVPFITWPRSSHETTVNWEGWCTCLKWYHCCNCFFALNIADGICPNNSGSHFVCFVLIEVQGLGLYVIDFEKFLLERAMNVLVTGCLYYMHFYSRVIGYKKWEVSRKVWLRACFWFLT